MTSRRFNQADAVAHTQKAMEELLADYGIDMTVRVEMLRDERSFSWRMHVMFGTPTKLRMDWAIDERNLSPELIEEEFHFLDEMIATDARFTIEVPEWQLQNLMSKSR